VPHGSNDIVVDGRGNAYVNNPATTRCLVRYPNRYRSTFRPRR